MRLHLPACAATAFLSVLLSDAAQGLKRHEMHPVLAMYHEALSMHSVFYPESGGWIRNLSPSKARSHPANEHFTASENVTPWVACYAANMGLMCATPAATAAQVPQPCCLCPTPAHISSERLTAGTYTAHWTQNSRMTRHSERPCILQVGCCIRLVQIPDRMQHTVSAWRILATHLSSTSMSWGCYHPNHGISVRL